MNTFSSEILSKLRNLESHLKSNIKGQDHVLPRICSVLQRGELNLAHPNRPKGSLLFVGPTGVGKTEITIAFTEYLCGSDHLHRFDMSEFQNQSSVGLLLGSSSTDTGMLGRALDKNGRGTLLFDEMEKAHPLVLDLFLQILDAGRITLAGRVLKPGYEVKVGDVLVIHYRTRFVTVRVLMVPERVVPSLKPADLYELVEERRDDPRDWLNG